MTELNFSDILHSFCLSISVASFGRSDAVVVLCGFIFPYWITTSQSYADISAMCVPQRLESKFDITPHPEEALESTDEPLSLARPSIPVPVLLLPTPEHRRSTGQALHNPVPHVP